MVIFSVSQAQQRYFTACVLCYFFLYLRHSSGISLPAHFVIFSVSQAQLWDFLPAYFVIFLYLRHSSWISLPAYLFVFPASQAQQRGHTACIVDVSVFAGAAAAAPSMASLSPAFGGEGSISGTGVSMATISADAELARQAAALDHERAVATAREVWGVSQK